MNIIHGWRYYNHALLPECPPHEVVDTRAIENGQVWEKYKGRVLFARWTSDFDCITPTNWWWCIADKPLDLAKLKSKRRYEHKKAAKYFKVKIIEPQAYALEIKKIRNEAFAAYPKKYRPRMETIQDIEQYFKNNYDGIVYGAFFQDGKLAGYTMVYDNKSHLQYSEQKTIPKYERYGINLALVDAVLNDYDEKLRNGYYIVDGERNVNHETHFQDYLIKYAGFRKAYCKLHIRFNPWLSWMMNFLFLFRRWLNKFDRIGFIHKMNAVFIMREIAEKE